MTLIQIADRGFVNLDRIIHIMIPIDEDRRNPENENKDLRIRIWSDSDTTIYVDEAYEEGFKAACRLHTMNTREILYQNEMVRRQLEKEESTKQSLSDLFPKLQP